MLKFVTNFVLKFVTYSCAEIWVDFCVEIWVDFCVEVWVDFRVEVWVDFRVEIWVDFRVEIVGTDRPTDRPTNQRTECLLEATQPSLKNSRKFCVHVIRVFSVHSSLPFISADFPNKFVKKLEHYYHTCL